jgi:DNA (cytosine-5)-methyltransferase 1
MLTFGAIAGKYRPRWLVWENVPGVLSSNGGRDFGSFLGMLGQLGYGFAYRVLDAQYFGVAQRRRRVFVVGYLGDWRPAAAVLFERQSLQGNPSPSREAGERVAERVAPSPGVSSHGGFAPELSHTLKAQANDKQDPTHQSYIAHTLKGEGFDASEDGPGRGTPLVPVAFPWQSALDPIGQPDNISGTLIKNQTMAVCAPIPISTMAGLRHEALGEGTGLGIGKPGDPANTLSKAHSHAVAQPSAQNLRPDPTRPVLLTMRDGKDGGGKGPLLQQDKSATLATANNQTLFQPGGRFVDAPMAVRRLTPRECERLQGFPDDFTAIPHRGKPAADGPRYKALGNSMAVPVMAWIGQRIQSTEVILARP